MNINANKFPLTRGINPWLAFPVIILFSVGAALIFSAIGLMFISFFIGVDQQELYGVLANQEINDAARWSLLVLQGFSALGAFIVGPALYIRVIDKNSLSAAFSTKGFYAVTGALTAAIVIAFMGVNAILIEWNANLNLPDFLEGFERWAARQEEQAQRLTQFLTAAPDLEYFLVAMIVIAVIPAVGEELLFRGLVQNKLYAATGSMHLAIWLGGFLFGAIHGQFYGLLPRMTLGVLFGYLYFWSGNLIIPMLAHFVNNGFTLLMMFLYRQEVIAYNVEEQASVPLSTFVISLAITVLLIYYFRKYYKKKPEDPVDQRFSDFDSA